MMKKTNLTAVEINFIQYVCECIAFNEPIKDLTEEGKLIARRLSQTTSNLILSGDNQVNVIDLPVKDDFPYIFQIEMKKK